MAQFGGTVFPDARYKLFKTYCMSLYGCQQWGVKSTVLVRLGEWLSDSINIRCLWRLPYRTHNVLLPLICRDLPVEIQLHKRFVKFFHKILHSENSIVYTCGLVALGGSCSAVCNSLNFVASKYNIDK